MKSIDAVQFCLFYWQANSISGSDDELSRRFHMKKFLLAAALAVLPVVAAFGADNPWVGTWKLDVSKSKFTGDTFTYSQSASGLYHYSDGSTEEYDFGIDGKEYPAPYGRVVAWTAAGDNAWNTVWKLNGTVLDNVHRVLTADGKTLTITDDGKRPDGSTFHDETVYARISGKTGLVGKWKSTKVTISEPDSITISSPAAGSIRWEIPQYKQTLEGKTDGSDIPVSGPTVPAGLTVSIKGVSSRKQGYTVKVGGKPINFGMQTLSADGKTLTDVSWSPGKESEKSTGVFEKQ
jgi:hypothetical protein